jgi:YD repeat-containing protein
MQLRLPFRSRPVWLGLLLLLTAGACNKAADGVTAKKCLLRSVDQTYSFSGSNTYTYGGTFEYNASRQLSKAILKSNTSFFGANEIQEFTYSPTQIEMKVNPAPTSATGGNLSATYLLNSAGYVTKIAATAWGTGSASKTQQTQNEFFEYNADGRLSKQTRYDGSYTTLEYSNGNLSIGRTYNSSGALTYVDTYTPYTDKTGAITGGADVFSALYVQGLFGKPTQNPVKSVVSTKGTTTTIDYTQTYTYAFDTDNNIASSLATSKSGTSTSATTYTTNYTYLCQ